MNGNRISHRIRTFICLSLFLSSAPPALAIDTHRSDIDQFIREVSARNNLDEAYVRSLLSEAEVKQSIIDAISRPAEKTKPWHEYRDIFITEKRIDHGVQFWREHRESVDQIACATGIPPTVIISILGVETFYGSITGSYRVIDALTTLAFEYPPRSRFFRSELEQFLLLTSEERVDPLMATGSYAGAMGAPQFISSSYRSYAIDNDGDGRRDLWSSWSDVMGSVANYFHAHGWRPDQPIVAEARVPSSARSLLRDDPLNQKETVGSLRKQGVEFKTSLPDDARAFVITLDGKNGSEYWVGFTNFYVITRYNTSVMYAMAVHQLGQEIEVRLNDDAS
ncbi:MAG: lytic murein transglycosylase B [Gammaproteobacteria bacterium]